MNQSEIYVNSAVLISIFWLWLLYYGYCKMLSLEKVGWSVQENSAMILQLLRESKIISK